MPGASSASSTDVQYVSSLPSYHLDIIFDLEMALYPTYTQTIINLLFYKPIAMHNSPILITSSPSFRFSIRPAGGGSPGGDGAGACAVLNNASRYGYFLA
jgi:hypothetical protein